MPGDLLNEPVNVVANTASIHDEAIARAQAVRASARKAVLALQDDKVLRRALLARPRKDRPFVSGDVVAYWRDQKWAKGVLSQGGQWYGSGVVIGLIGRNVIIAHRRSIIRCAPEQVRPATSEERALIETPGTELLGIKDMIQNGTFRSAQYVDLLSQSYPPQEEAVVSGPSGSHEERTAVGAQVSSPTAQNAQSEQQAESPVDVDMPKEVDKIFDDEPSEVVDKSAAPASSQSSVAAPSGDSSLVGNAEASSSYGPVRRTRVPSKSGPLTMLRPAAMKHEDFVEVMREVVPKLIEGVVQQGESTSDVSHKRSADSSAEVPEPKAAKTEDPALCVEHAIAYVATAECENQESQELWNTFKNTTDNAVEVFINQYFSKRAQKEIPASRNEPLLQARVDQAKVAEWQTLIDKGAVRVVPASESRWIRKHKPNRIMGSRFVIVKKPEEEIVENGGIPDPANMDHWRVKARWCLQGHLDPDLSEKARAGQLQSPTLSQMGRTVMFQLMASHKWLLQLGDVKGAFLEAGPIPECYRPLFANLPAGGIPGVDPECLLEILGNVYGQNDAPAAWHKVFDEAVVKAGFERSRFDNCLYWMRENGELTGCLGAHVDDTATGGVGQKYEQALAYLRNRFPYRKRRTGEGEFCGSHYRQCPTTKAQAMVAATGTLEWIALILAEALDGIGEIREWVPTNHVLADSLTKSAGDPTDLLRACIRNAKYQISAEETVLKMQAEERQRRERVLLNELLSRASVSTEVTEPSTPGSFSVIESMDGAGAMSDASKRRGTEFLDGLSKRMYAPAAEMESCGEPMCKSVGVTPHGQPIFLPSGVDSVEIWGRSVIQFGKFMPKKGVTGISYEELFQSRDEDKLSYVDWVVKQVRGAKGLLLDLGLYLCIRKTQTETGDQLPISWWLTDEAANDRYQGLYENWEMLLAVWDHLLCFHLDDLTDCGFDHEVARRFLERCLQFRVGDAARVKQLLDPLIHVVAL
eukprot:s382_g10.t1